MSADNSSSQNSTEYEFDSNSSSLSLELTELSAAMLATHPEYAIVWELLQGCQEAAIEDIPERHRGCLSIFDDIHVQGQVAYQNSDPGDYDELFRVAGATKCWKPWSLPTIARPISEEDALWAPNMQVLNLAQVIPTAAVFLTPDAALSEKFQRITDAVTSPTVAEDTTILFQNASPFVDVKLPVFASGVFTSASQIARHGEALSFRELRRYNRLATTSLLRQAQSFGIDSSVVGILLQGHLVAFHVDWHEERDETSWFYSAMYAPGDEMTDSKTWDLRKDIEAAEVKIILSNLRKYTAGLYAARVSQGLKTVKKPFQPWKWNPSLLPDVLTYSRLQKHTEEPSEEKVARWQGSVAIPVHDAIHRSLLQQKLEGNSKRLRDILSPPSTPQSVEGLVD